MKRVSEAAGLGVQGRASSDHELQHARCAYVAWLYSMEPISALQGSLDDRLNPQTGLEQIARAASSTAPLYLFDRTLRGERLRVDSGLERPL